RGAGGGRGGGGFPGGDLAQVLRRPVGIGPPHPRWAGAQVVVAGGGGPAGAGPCFPSASRPLPSLREPAPAFPPRAGPCLPSASRPPPSLRGSQCGTGDLRGMPLGQKKGMSQIGRSLGRLISGGSDEG